MPTASLIRTVRFPASHRYWRDDWTDQQNQDAFGAQAEAHEHVFSLTVEVGGTIDPQTGFVADLPALDQILEEIVDPLRRGLLNEVLTECADGGLPTTENLSLWFFRRIGPRLPGGLTLRSVSVAESGELRAEYRG